MAHASSCFLRLARTVLVMAGPLTAASAMADARIEFELVTEQGFPLTGAHEWTRLLADMKLDRVRIRSGTGGQQPAIETSGSDTSPIYYVTGVLNARNQLQLPGGTFGLRDKAGLKDWLLRLAEGGEDGLTASRAAFGLTARQLVALHNALAVKVRTPTKGQRVERVLESIAQDAAQPTAVDPSVISLVRGESVCAGELMGLASGTALAALLRPLNNRGA